MPREVSLRMNWRILLVSSATPPRSRPPRCRKHPPTASRCNGLPRQGYVIGVTVARFPEQLRSSDPGAAYGSVHQRLQRVDTILRRLHGNVVADAGSGFTQKVGAVWKLQLSDTSRFCAMSRCVSPTCCARTRSTSRFSVGSFIICCTCTSTAPGTCRNRFAICCAIR